MAKTKPYQSILKFRLDCLTVQNKSDLMQVFLKLSSKSYGFDKTEKKCTYTPIVKFKIRKLYKSIRFGNTQSIASRIVSIVCARWANPLGEGRTADDRSRSRTAWISHAELYIIIFVLLRATAFYNKNIKILTSSAEILQAMTLRAIQVYYTLSHTLTHNII